MEHQNVNTFNFFCINRNELRNSDVRVNEFQMELKMRKARLYVARDGNVHTSGDSEESEMLLCLEYDAFEIVYST